MDPQESQPPRKKQPARSRTVVEYTGPSEEAENRQNEVDEMDDGDDDPARPSRPSRKNGQTTTTSPPKKPRKSPRSALPRQVVGVQGKWFQVVDLTTDQVQFHAL